MIRNKTGKFLLAGLAAFAYYKYAKMSPEEKQKFAGNIKEKGKKLYNDYVPAEVKNMLHKKDGEQAGRQSFEEGTGGY
jgi:hypothetical protein